MAVAMDLEGIVVSAGHRVLGPVATAVEALEMVERTPPDLALLNIRLLDGVSGLTVAKHLKNRWGIPAIFVSASLREAYEHSELAVSIVGKPFKTETVMLAIKRGGAVVREKRPPITQAAVDLKLDRH
jgi:CheY-like chemotaxis protein